MDNRQKILEVLFEEPDRDFHIRLLARRTGLHPNTVIKVTAMLAQEGLITKEKSKETNFHIIRANTSNRMFRLAKLFFNINKIYTSGIIDALNDTFAYPTIILFGSYAKAENTKESDIDLFIITAEKKHFNTDAFLEKLDAEIQLFVHTKSEFGKVKKQNKELINNVMNGIILEGYIEVV